MAKCRQMKLMRPSRLVAILLTWLLILQSAPGAIGWTHDAKERLTDESSTSGSRSSGTVTGTNAYDGASNPTTLRGTSSISYNSNNQRSYSSGTWEYDGNGNPTKYRGKTNTYDLPGRMTSLRDGNNWSVGYTYGADGLLASRAVTIYTYQFGQWLAASTEPTYYIHDGGEPVFEISSSQEANEGEDAQSEYNVVAINVRGPDGLIARKHSGNWIYYEFDQQGNVAQRRDSSGTLLTSSLYDAYGTETNNGGTPTDPFGYNAQWGYWLDRTTGLYLCQARWYDSVTARWVNRDPIGYAGGANLYGYCGGGPVGAIDALGLYILVLRADVNHSWIALYNDNGTLLHTLGTWSGDGALIDLEDMRSSHNERAMYVPDFQVPQDTNWSLTYNCADFAEAVWEANGGTPVYEPSLIRTPWGMMEQIEQENRSNPTGVLPPQALRRGIQGRKGGSNAFSDSYSHSSSNYSSSTSSGSGSSGSGSLVGRPRRGGPRPAPPRGGGGGRPLPMV